MLAPGGHQAERHDRADERRRRPVQRPNGGASPTRRNHRDRRRADIFHAGFSRRGGRRPARGRSFNRAAFSSRRTCDEGRAGWLEPAAKMVRRRDERRPRAAEVARREGRTAEAPCAPTALSAAGRLEQRTARRGAQQPVVPQAQAVVGPDGRVRRTERRQSRQRALQGKRIAREMTACAATSASRRNARPHGLKRAQ